MTSGHNISAYNRGCRCATCKAAKAAARRRQRAAKPDAPRNVVAFPTTTSPVQAAAASVGPVETAVIAELETLPKTGDFAGVAAAARAVAAAIDDPKQRSYISRNGNTLKDLLNQLRTKKKKSGGRLAVVAAMAGRRAKAR